MMQSAFTKRFSELEQQYAGLPFASMGEGLSGRYAPISDWKKWATSVESLLLAVCGEESPYYKSFMRDVGACSGYEDHLKGLGGIFHSAKEDFEAGYIFNVDLKVSGEVFGDFVALAKQALSAGYKDVAAVLACAALEDALKRFAIIKQIQVEEKTMQDVVNALKSGGHVFGAQKTLLDAMPKVRNFAMHGNWDKISGPDVSSVIGFVEQFLLSNFG